MNMKSIPATTASKEFGRYLDMVQREPIIVTKKNRPVAVTLSIQDAEEFFDYKVAQGVARGLDDVENRNFAEMTPEYAAEMKARFRNIFQK